MNFSEILVMYKSILPDAISFVSTKLLDTYGKNLKARKHINQSILKLKNYELFSNKSVLNFNLYESHNICMHICYIKKLGFN